MIGKKEIRETLKRLRTDAALRGTRNQQIVGRLLKNSDSVTPENFKHLVDAELGSRIDGFVSFIDFGVTTLRLAGVDVPVQVDGRPFLGKGV